jgi:hypothetical protein
MRWNGIEFIAASFKKEPGTKKGGTREGTALFAVARF